MNSSIPNGTSGKILSGSWRDISPKLAFTRGEHVTHHPSGDLSQEWSRLSLKDELYRRIREILSLFLNRTGFFGAVFIYNFFGFFSCCFISPSYGKLFNVTSTINKHWTPNLKIKLVLAESGIASIGFRKLAAIAKVLRPIPKFILSQRIICILSHPIFSLIKNRAWRNLMSKSSPHTLPKRTWSHFHPWALRQVMSKKLHAK